MWSLTSDRFIIFLLTSSLPCLFHLSLIIDQFPHSSVPLVYAAISVLFVLYPNSCNAPLLGIDVIKQIALSLIIAFSSKLTSPNFLFPVAVCYWPLHFLVSIRDWYFYWLFAVFCLHGVIFAVLVSVSSAVGPS